jgi:hypothetical protein
VTELIMRLKETVSDARGVFSPSVMARARADGSWEGWLEFTSMGADGVTANVVTGIETHQHDRVGLARWASGLTRVYAEGALIRAKALQLDTPASELLGALAEIVEALDRRIPQVERASEPEIAADAKRLRAGALHRMVSLRRQLATPHR